VANLMTHQQIIDGVACLLPHREGQDTGVDVEASSLHLLVLHDQVLSGKQFGKLGFDFVFDCHGVSLRCPYNTKPPAEAEGP